LRSGAPLLGLALVLLCAAPAGAIAVSHAVNSGMTNLSGNVSASFDFDVNTSIGDFDGNASLSGSFNTTSSGNILVDWGAPGWSDSLAVAPFDLQFNSPGGPEGTGSGTITIPVPLFPDFDVPVNLTVNLDFLSMALSTPFNASPLLPSEIPPGGGPWTGVDSVVFSLGGQFDLGISVLGVGDSVNNIDVGPLATPGLPIPMTLERLGGDPGTGSRLSFGIGPISLSAGPFPSFNTPVPGCEVDTTLGCAFDLQSVDTTITTLTFSDLSMNIVADQIGTSIPEPSTLALLGLGTAILAWGARRRR